MIWSAPKLWLYGAAAAIVVAIIGAQAVRVSMLKSELAQVQAERAQERQAAADAALAESVRLNDVAGQLIKTQEERDAALKQTGRKVIEYVSRPGAAGVCLDADGLRLVAELARGASSDPGEPAGQVPAGASSAN